jgi:hypothetical protein
MTPMLWFMFVIAVLHALIPVAWLAAYFGLRHLPLWIQLWFLVPLWLGLAVLDAGLFFGQSSLVPWLILDVPLRTGIPILLALTTTLLLRKWRVAILWQAGGASAVGMASMLLQPSALLYLLCGLAGECI